MTTAIATPATAVRRATAADYDAIMAMGTQFVEETAYRQWITPNPEVWARTVTALLEGTIGTILVSDDEAGRPVGLIAATVFPNFASGLTMASDIVLWIEPPSRSLARVRALVAAYEAWATHQGAVVATLVSWHRRLDTFYGRLGYRETERTFMKEL
jgi:hypothetical protein